MSLDVRIRCSICAWRAECTKKHKIKESRLHCPDYVRDAKLPKLPGEVDFDKGGMEHKRIVDPFAK